MKKKDDDEEGGRRGWVETGLEEDDWLKKAS